MKKIVKAALAAAFAVASLLGGAGTGATADLDGLDEGLYAEMVTAKGSILIRLHEEETPMTVANFVGLAEGTKDSNKKKGVPFYDGTVFHRVIKDFMIQGGDPQGSGGGGPGYKFPDEISPSLRHDGPGVLSMANAGSGTNGSQFLITHKATPWLDGKHSVFGHVVRGLDTVDAIAKGDVLEKVVMHRVGKKYGSYRVDQAGFDKAVSEKDARAKADREKASSEVEETIKKKWPDAVKTPSGLRFVVTAPGSGPTPPKGTKISAHYTGTLVDGKKFDSSRDRGRPFTFNVGNGRVIKGWDEAFLGMKKGEKRILIIPPALGYGSRGAPPAIPPGATLIFDVELLDF